MKKPIILIAEDDLDDQLLLKSAFLENGGDQTLDFVEDGVGLMYYLNNISQRGTFDDFPDFIMLDLNMPKKDGKEALKDIKQHPVFKKIPVIIYTTTRDQHEVHHCYELGANTYIVKPSDFRSIVKIVNNVLMYWYTTASIPSMTENRLGWKG